MDKLLHFDLSDADSDRQAIDDSSCFYEFKIPLDSLDYVIGRAMNHVLRNHGWPFYDLLDRLDNLPCLVAQA